MAHGYVIPAETIRAELVIHRSRFIATIGMAESVETAREFIARIRAEMPDATHHVYAFRVGFGSSVQEGLSDDGEPAGTSGKPAMAVLRGADIGDVVLVVTRYFGGIKLGTGGLVRAYSSAAKAAINNFTQWMAVHLADVGIRVNAMAPGFFLTEQNRTLLTKPDGSWTPRAEKVIAHTPMRRMGTPEDLLGTLIWMADEKQSGFVTGIVVAIDGGFMAYSGV